VTMPLAVDRTFARKVLQTEADAVLLLNCHLSEEAFPMNLVPTFSTTLALSDAVAMTLLNAKGFRDEDFANLHPGGNLGKRLLRAEPLMHQGSRFRRSRPRRPCVRSSRRYPRRDSA